MIDHNIIALDANQWMVLCALFALFLWERNTFSVEFVSENGRFHLNRQINRRLYSCGRA